VTTVGVLGAGQLGRMLGLAGRALDLDFEFLDPAPDPPARIAGHVIARPFDDAEGLAMLAERCDVVTYEFENVPVTAVVALAERVPVYPAANALETAQDRLHEKQLFAQLGIPVPAWQAVESIDDLQRAAEAVGLPMVLKSRRMGYDGKGQAVAHDHDGLREAFARLGGRPLIAEQLVPFDREVSVIGARRKCGETAIWPLSENRHEAGILRCSLAPVDDDAIVAAAHGYIEAMLSHFNYVGVLALELFVVGNRVLANEFAPRVHNSGHWTIDGAVTSQFENHLRAILDLPLGDTAARGHAVMVNLIGCMPTVSGKLARAGFRLHDYDKAPRPGRKLGHITALADSAAGRDRCLAAALGLLHDRAEPGACLREP
jgi:5-(carboxyamino)imidazole ribonucleotide synthase